MQVLRCAALAAAVMFSLPAAAAAQSSPAPGYFTAITDRVARPEPPLPSLPAAGSMIIDPLFESAIYRITDRSTRPARLDRSYRTPSSAHQHSWSLSGRYFYVVSTDGTVIPFTFDDATGRGTRVNPSATGEGGLILQFFIEPQFSYLSDNLIYGSFNGSGATLRTIDQYDFSSGRYSQLMNLDLLAPNLAGTYVGWIGSSAGPTERVAAVFGGPGQDYHYLAVVFDKNDPARRRVVNTRASTIDGRATNIPLNFSLHGMAIDRSGRYAMLYSTWGDMSGTRKAAPSYLWDIDTGHITEMPLVAANNGGHDAYGYGTRVNQFCCTSSTTYDGVEWQFRSLDNPLVTRDVIPVVMTPKLVQVADHPSWHNARPDVLVPFISALFRSSPDPAAWRAWDEEIVGVQPDPPAGSPGVVWRFAHHRSDVRSDTDPTRSTFWYMPRPSVSDDGRWALFTSNWEKSLGIDPGGDAMTSHRQDVFLVRLKGTAVAGPVVPEPEPPPTTDPVATIAVRTTSLAAVIRTKPYSATVTAENADGMVTWKVTSGALPPGLVLNPTTGTIAGVCTKAGNWGFVVSATDSSNSATRQLSLQVKPK